MTGRGKIIVNVQAHRPARLPEIFDDLSQLGYEIDLSIDTFGWSASDHAAVRLGDRPWRPSLPVIWCGPSQVTNLIESIRAAMSAPVSWDYWINISGDTLALDGAERIGPRLDAEYASGARVWMNWWRLARPMPADLPLAEAAAARFVGLGPAFRGHIHCEEALVPVFRDRDTNPLRHPERRFFLSAREQLIRPGAAGSRPAVATETGRSDPGDTQPQKRLFVSLCDDREKYRVRQELYRSGLTCSRAWFVLHRSACEEFLRGIERGKCSERLSLAKETFQQDETFFASTFFDVFQPNQIFKNIYFGFGGGVAKVDERIAVEQKKAGAIFVRKFDFDRTDIRRILRSS